jgi:hypothetical protein
VLPPEPDEDPEQPETDIGTAPGTYEVFDPDGLQWRL